MEKSSTLVGVYGKERRMLQAFSLLCFKQRAERYIYISLNRWRHERLQLLSHSPLTHQHNDIPRPKTSNGDNGFHLIMSVT